MENLKALTERHNELVSQMEGIISVAGTEQRALSEEERNNFDALEQELKDVDATLDREQRARNAAIRQPSQPSGETVEEAEERAFADYVMGRVTEMRAGEQNLSMGNNGAVIPTSIANRIIKAVKDRCPILEGATLYRVKGTLKIPVWGKANTTHDITVGYSTEFNELTADSGKFTSVDLGGYLAGALTLVSKSVENNAVFSVVDFVVDQMAEEIALFLEKELLTGTGSSAAQGALNTTNVLTAASATAVTADELIELQAKV